jgi:alkylation response protein AidB-like acyl-CoA dehydrogenase
MAQTDDGPQPFLVEGDSKGLVRHPMSKIGRRVGDNAEIFFDNVRVPPGPHPAAAPKGRTDMGTHVDHRLALTLGLGRAALEETLKYTQERVGRQADHPPSGGRADACRDGDESGGGAHG